MIRTTQHYKNINAKEMAKTSSRAALEYFIHDAITDIIECRTQLLDCQQLLAQSEMMRETNNKGSYMEAEKPQKNGNKAIFELELQIQNLETMTEVQNEYSARAKEKLIEVKEQLKRLKLEGYP